MHKYTVYFYLTTITSKGTKILKCSYSQNENRLNSDQSLAQQEGNLLYFHLIIT